MAGVEADHRLVAEGGDLGVAGPPVWNVSVIKRGLEELVLEHEALLVADAVVDLLQRVSESVLAAAQVGLSGIVGSVGEPDLEVARAGRVHDVDALEVMVDRLLPHGQVDVSEAPQLVGLILKCVRVDRSEKYP